MTKMTVYTMTDLHTEAKEYARRLGGEVQYIFLGVTQDGQTSVMVRWRNGEGLQYTGSFTLRYLDNGVEGLRLIRPPIGKRSEDCHIP